MYSYMLCVFLPERRLSYIVDVVSLFAEFNGGDGLHYMDDFINVL